MPRWTDGLVDAFPVPDDALSRLSLNGRDGALGQIEPDKDRAVALETPHNSDPFPFFSLPAELRNRIYNLVLFTKPPYRLVTGKRKGSRLAILLASKRFHQEASYALYTTHKFLIFPVQEFTALPTIQELPLHYRILVSNLAMKVGSSWTNPPKTWRVSKLLRRCLINLKNVQTVSVFVDLDPSHPAIQKRFRISDNFYTDFVGDLLGDVLDAMPQIKYVQLDGNPSVDVHGPLVSRLREEALEQEKQVRWGREAGWAHKADLPPPSIQGLQPQSSEASLPPAMDFVWPAVVDVNTSILHNPILERVKNV